MFNLNASLLSGATSWDTNYARKYLQISKDQLEKIKKIPGWSKTPENDKTSENIDKLLTQQTSTSTGSTLTTITNTSSKDNYNLKFQSHISDLQSKQKSKSEKELFLKNFSLSPLKGNNTSANLLKRSSSLPDLHQEFQSHNNPEEFYRKRVHSLEKENSRFRHLPLLTKNLLNETYTVQLISDGDADHDKHVGINNKYLSCPSEQPNQLSRQKKLKTLDDSILNHKYLKDVQASVIKSDADPFSSNGAIQAVLKQEMNSFEKKLLLLEKRLSPSKEMSTLPFNAKLINTENLNCEKNLKSSQNLAPAEISTTVISSNSVEKVPEKVQNFSVSQSHEYLKPQADIQSLNVKSYAYDKDRTTDILKTAVSNFEGFLSPEIPCGQPVPTEVPSSSQPFPLQESAKLNTPSNFQNTSPLVPCGQPLPVEVPSETQPIPLQKTAKLNAPSKPQNAKVLDNIKMPEKTSSTFSVFSASSNEKVSNLVSSKELGTKRKRRNKSEKSSKKLDMKKIKRIDIQFSSAQIKSMLEIMKLFHIDV